MVRFFIACVIALGALIGIPGRAHAEDLKFATLAPKESAWGKVFSTWAKAVDSESKGSLKMTWYWNGAQGDEAEMIGKMRSRQLAGGAFTATGLTRVFSSGVRRPKVSRPRTMERADCSASFMSSTCGCSSGDPISSSRSVVPTSTVSGSDP